ncbi:MFS transporter [Arhodomonas sp. AD133]|uniref:MFS transporter n=1 Tax=Arhodomonas sp. AD133 TaxID=3415009 RepID=UPI003EB929DE
MKAARRATSLVFFVAGALLATWGPHVPTVQERLDLTPGVLGVVLLAPAVGGLAAMIVTAGLIQHFGSARVTRTAGVVASLLLPVPVLAPSLSVLAGGLLAFGACLGATDVAMNAQGVEVERAYARPIMSSLHAQFSIGGLAGAGLATLLLSMHITASAHVVAVAAACAFAVAVAGGAMLADGQATAAEESPRFARPRGLLLVLGIVGVLSMLGEGAMLDWAAVYLRSVLEVGPGMAAAGFAAFSATMTAGRLMGDRVVARLGRVRVLRGGGLVAGTGLALGLAFDSPAAAVAGFAAVGLGLANVVPLVFAAASRVPGVPPGHGLAAVSTVGYFGFLVGPPAIGAVSELTTLTLGLSLVVAFSLTISVLAGQAAPRGVAPAESGNSLGVTTN